jgi:multiple antibiotic resistance protein
MYASMITSYLLDTLLAFIPIFVAIDVIGILPIFLSLTEGMNKAQRRGVIRQSVVTALAVGIGFLVVGKFIFALLGITVSDFKIAGGILLLIFAVRELIIEDRVTRAPSSTMGVVPIGMPLIVGPAVLTSLLILGDTYHYLPTITSFIINLGIVWIVFSQAEVIIRTLGEGGTKGVAKVASLLLAAIAVMMIRRGLVDLIKELTH